MSLDYDRQFLTRLLEPVTTVAKAPLTRLPSEELKHGTTIGAFVVEDGSKALAFSDGKVSMGGSPVHMSYRKMLHVDPFTIMLFSGSPSLAVRVGRALRSWVGYREDTTNAPMTPRGKELALETMLMQGIGLMGAGILLAPILATYDAQKKRVRLFNFGPDGSMTEHDRYTVSGSGMPSRLILRERWSPGMSVAAGVELIRRLITEIPETVDSFSGGKPSIDLIGPEGISTVEA